MPATRAPRAACSGAVARHGHARAESVLVWILRPADASYVARMGAWEKAWVPDVVFEQDALDLAEKGESAYRSVYRKEPQAMGMNLAQKLIASHLVEGRMEVGTEIGLKIDQTLTQDATGTLVMLELEAMQLPRVKTELSAQYVDHNLLQTDFKNADDHLFLRSACQQFGLWYSRPGNGVSHPVHMERFGIPDKTLLGSDSHTCAAGSLGMLAIGAGGLEVALAMIGEPVYVKMPRILGVKLTGELPDWVSAKDVILEMLRR